MSKPTMKDALREQDRMFRAFTNRDVEAIALGLTEHVHKRNPLGLVEGNLAVQADLQQTFDAFPDCTFEFTERMIDPDLTRRVTAWTFRGTHTHGFHGVPATGRYVEFDGLTLLKMQGLLVDEWLEFYDNYAVMSQLGMLPHQAGLGFRVLTLGEVSLNKARSLLHLS